MTHQQLSLILNALDQKYPKAMSVLALVRDTKIPMQDLRRYLNGHPEFFVATTTTKTYRINPFSPYKRSIEKMFNEITYCLGC